MFIDDYRYEQLTKFQESIGIFFDNLETLNVAFIHPSYTNGQQSLNNQRLEFLGDAVLELVVSEYLFQNFSRLSEGQMTKIRAFSVCEQSLAKIAQKLRLGDYLILGKGEENNGGREKASILADTFEALIGAIFIEKGFETSSDFILKNLKPFINKAIEGEDAITDYKTTLQELLQKNSVERLSYEVEKEEGPAHNKVFYVKVIWKGKVLGRGSGKNKKEAEQKAAQEALHVLNKDMKI